MPINSEHLAQLTDADVVDQNGDKVGGVGQIYLDDASGQPAWVSVKSGLFGLRESFVPLAGADVTGGNIQVPYTKDFIKDAPRVDAENHLDDSQQATLFSYYGVDRGAVGSGGLVGGGADQTAAFGSEQTAADMYDGRSEGEPAPVSETVAGDGEPDGALTTEYTTPGTSDDLSAGPVADGSGTDLGSGDLTEADAAAASSGVGGETSWARDAATIGAGAAAGAGAAGVAASSDDAESTVTESTDATWAAPEAGADDAGSAPQVADATYQQANPSAQADWAAEQTPEEPVSTEWSVPSTDPSEEEATKVGRSGYASDQPAAHSAAYEGHGGAGLDSATDEGAVYAADADAASASDAGFGTVEPVSTDSTDEAADSGFAAGDDAVTGAQGQTGTGYPGEVDSGSGDVSDVASDSGTFGAGGAVLGGAVAGGAAAAGYSASQSDDTTAYEVPGAETGEPITETDSGAAFDADLEQPADAATSPVDTFAAGTDTGAGESGEPEVFGAQGYRPDRDGTEMSDEEREELNQARGAL